jgi:hypothetical protein
MDQMRLAPLIASSAILHRRFNDNTTKPGDDHEHELA